MHPLTPVAEAMLEVKGKAIQKQYNVHVIDEKVPNLACFYKKLHIRWSIHTGLAL